MELVHEDGEFKGGFYLRDEDGETLGEMTYSKAGEKILIFDHTWVDDSLRGQGKARELLDAGVAWAREIDKKINPQCPYVAKQFEKDESLADLKA